MNRHIEQSSPHFLIIRLSSIGDIVLASPVIRQLREHYPDARLDFLVRQEYAELVKYNPHLNRAWIYDVQSGWQGLRHLKAQLRREGYDAIIDLHANFRSYYLTSYWWHPPVFRYRKNSFIRFLLVHFKVNLYHRKFAHIPSVADKYLNAVSPLLPNRSEPKLEVYLPDEVISQMRQRWEQLAGEGFGYLIAPGARHFTKRWPGEYFQELIRRVYTELGKSAVLVGSEEEKDYLATIVQGLPKGAAVNLGGQLSLLETAGLIQAAPFFISNDSGLMHIAAAFQRPQVAIFGSTTRELGFFPLNPHARVLENRSLNCRPCSHIGRSRCPKKHFKCMREITPEQVFEVVKDFIS